jgi:hypothetical protein
LKTESVETIITYLLIMKGRSIMETKKRVCCLYRVSRLVQVDKENDDIPMQKQACREFAERQGWHKGW